MHPLIQLYGTAFNFLVNQPGCRAPTMHCAVRRSPVPAPTLAFTRRPLGRAIAGIQPNAVLLIHSVREVKQRLICDAKKREKLYI